MTRRQKGAHKGLASGSEERVKRRNKEIFRHPQPAEIPDPKHCVAGFPARFRFKLLNAFEGFN